MKPVVKARGLAFATLAAPDLDAMEKFLRDFGLHVAARTPDRLYMRAAGPDAYVHVTQKGAPAFVGVAFDVESEDDLRRLAQLPGASAIEPLPGPGGGLRVRLKEPNGYCVEAVCGRDGVTPLPVVAHALNTRGAAPARAGQLARLPLGPSHVQRIGHVVMTTPRVAQTVEWFQRTFGLLPTDEVWAETPDNVVGSFNRLDRGGEFVDHHCAMFIHGGVAGLNHLAFEVADIDDVFTGHEHLKATGPYEHMYGVGRHLLGSQVFDYWADPWGRVHEHWTDTDVLDASAQCQRMDIREGFVSQWGGEPPQKLLVRVSP